ncbi:MAG: NUMOD3 domain-containing DNA-binding protein [Cetobacterium sp.]
MYGFIYLTTNTINGKMYIGQKNYKKDFRTYLGSGTALKLAVEKYGRENFVREILCECKDLEEMNHMEHFFTSLVDAENNPDFYNLKAGGNQKGYSQETRNKMSRLKIGKKLSEDNRRKLLKSLVGREVSEATKNKISEKLKGVKHTLERKNNISESKKGSVPWNKGLEFSEEVKIKMSEAKKGKPFLSKRKPLSYYENNKTTRCNFKKICKTNGWVFEDFEEIWCEEKDKHNKKIYFYKKQTQEE